MSKKEEKTEEEVPYLGNIWGWDLTYKMLVFLVFMLILVVARSCYLGVNPFLPVEATVEATDNPEGDTPEMRPD